MSVEQPSERSHTSQTGYQFGRFVRMNYDRLGGLPDAEESFFRRDLPDETAAIVDKLLEIDAIEVVEEGYYESAHEFQVTDAFGRVLADYEPPEETLPCGHRAFSNLGDGVFACAREWCDVVYDRETVAEVFE